MLRRLARILDGGKGRASDRPGFLPGQSPLVDARRIDKSRQEEAHGEAGTKPESGSQMGAAPGGWLPRSPPPPQARSRPAPEFLQALRQQTCETIPLAWGPAIGPGVYAIEVYPAATLKAYLHDVPGYKGAKGHVARQAVVRFLDARMRLPAEASLMETSDDALTRPCACLPVRNLLGSRALKPAGLELARKEGWIWVREPGG